MFTATTPYLYEPDTKTIHSCVQDLVDYEFSKEALANNQTRAVVVKLGGSIIGEGKVDAIKTSSI